jgi:hypothetical protein
MEVQYRVEFYDGPISEEEVVNFIEPSRRSYPFSVGHFVNPFGWGGKNQSTEKHRCQIAGSSIN